MGESEGQSVGHKSQLSATDDDASLSGAGPSAPSFGLSPGSENTDEYPIRQSGLYVILMTTTFGYHFHGNKPKDLNYGPDKKKLLECFGLSEKSSNLILGENISGDFPASTKKEKKQEFSNFMNRIKDYEGNPDFVFVAVMSHGFKDGSFLLAGNKDCNERYGCKLVCDPNHADEEEHTLTGTCNARSLYDSVVKPIQECDRFIGKPKIFMLQACRGSMTGYELARTKGPRPPAPKIADSYIPQLSDTIIMYPCADEHISWVGSGSRMIQTFCGVMEELKKEEIRLKGVLPDNILELRVPIESLTDGWIFDVCLKVSRKVSNDLVTSGPKTPFDKQQPVFFSSLRYKLSCLKILCTTK